eukprot:3080817-Lingulodinium_polyedra.AAC.1
MPEAQRVQVGPPPSHLPQGVHFTQPSSPLLCGHHEHGDGPEVERDERGEVTALIPFHFGPITMFM